MPGSAPDGLHASEVTEADFIFVTHAHFDHLYGADTIALNTGATVIGNPVTIQCLRDCGVPESQLLQVTGGETVDCGKGVTVKAIPALHSCLFAASDVDSGKPVTGDLGISAQQRDAKINAMFEAASKGTPETIQHSLKEMLKHTAISDGGQLAYLLTTPDGTVLISGSAGCWRSVYSELRPDMALLSVAGRPNLDGEPYQGSKADFLMEQVEMLGHPKRVGFCHQESLVPGELPDENFDAAVKALADKAPDVEYVEFEIATPIPLFG
jgi:L-ascorbate metabolism protein UlaG (beta-lactamase superfamily)